MEFNLIYANEYNINIHDLCMLTFKVVNIIKGIV